MRRFELVEGSVAKFWEISRNRAQVTVRWGLAGTSGESTVKVLDDPASAAAHETKLVAEKTENGYVETLAAAPVVSQAGPSQAPSSPKVVSRDEDTFVLPSAWYRHRYARRGSGGSITFTAEPNARALLDRQMTDTVNKVLQAATTDTTVARQAVAWLEGKPDATPLGAAAVTVTSELGNWMILDQLTHFADVWIAEHGLRFAAEAATELMTLKVTDNNLPPEAHYHYMQDNLGVRHMRAGESRGNHAIDLAAEITLRIRHALAAASDDDYADVVAALTPYRAGHPYARAATSVLVPSQREWVARDIADAVTTGDQYLAAFLTAATGTKEELTELVPVASPWFVFRSLPILTTIVDAVGTGTADALFHWLGHPTADADSQRRLLSILERLPGDEVMQGLIDRADHKYVMPALLKATERHPVRAMRLLSESASQRSIAGLLQAHVLAHPALVDQVLPELEPEAAKRIQAIIADSSSLRVAPLSAVPSLLVDPPWRRPAKTRRPVVLGNLECHEPAAIDWAAGERDTWALVRFDRGHRDDSEPWESRWHRIQANNARWSEAPSFFIDGPEAYVRPLLAHWKPRETWMADDWLRIIAARFGLDSLPLVLTMARSSPAEIGKILVPFFSTEVAMLMAEWLARLKTARATALAWLLRHPASAARALVPSALAKNGVPRRQAENALLALHHHGHSDAVRSAAREYGTEAAVAIDTLLDSDPITVLPIRMPASPSWVTPGTLPPVKLRDGSGVLPGEAVANLITVLSIARLDTPYAGMDVVKAACDPASLSEFGWGLFQRWQVSGSPSKDNWILDALGHTGNDETVRLLSPMVLAWPGEGGHANAVSGLSALAAIGTDVALMHLHGIAQRARFKALKTAAQQKMDEVAAGLGLNVEQLADRLVPDLGLDAGGNMRLDYGPRQFTVGFDERLRPFVTDVGGKRLRALPKPGVRDDDELAPAAYRRFTSLKKDVRTMADSHIRRLERAMVTGRRWTGAEFRRLFVSHPLMWHIVRRLVWGRYDVSGTLMGALRVAEDRSFATVDEDETTVADDESVGVAHPLDLGDTLPDWVAVFADYEILQPFPQLGRPVFTLTREEASSNRLTRFEGITVPTGQLLGLERRGWRREAPQDAGVQGCIELPLDGGREVVIDLDPGVVVGVMDLIPEQTLDRVYVWTGDGTRSEDRSKAALALSELDAITVSEVIRELTEITA
ncbi:DUF4132 domain-containing protein [Actinoplanes sp. TBRC 11911]|uniref:DUF4132 domain-containing protein n=1 Tax=Actinoplanes sp. TBRC 11911 TaxID=2729386 RepID=UPI00145F542E|nr:DUF4132 domain-containing protein [Actinoplanes sp. TBRC 11911]NMO55362.1 DUF4132 domain-containing protein [Actinoplanes sp. TBRC 11911]